ncbi:AfsR/SARP family transcriptional regulator [Actinophytocola sp.]|uniref:AfsR/SARP family transcriptional regulator n=1 Tax=Actinophytocola sp. TaxID=1872138 RepID=UPI002ED0D60F
MDIRLLGPVEVWADDRRVADLGTPQQRAVLAALAVDAGRPVMLQTLIDRVWDQAPPVGTRPALYAHISRLRKTLSQAGAAPEQSTGPVRQAGGYALTVDPDQVDLHRFRRLAAAASDPVRPDGEQAQLLREALGLWRGPPLADLSGEWATRMREDWTQQRLDAVVAWAWAELRLDRHDEVIGPVRNMLAEHPLTEPLTVILMRALVMAGRDAEALDRYSSTRARLADELGTEPGPELRALHTAILRGDLLPVRDTKPGPVPLPARSPIPRQLPAHTSRFVGRAQELGQLASLLENSTPGGGTVVITAIKGTAGVGKTALALHWAHHIAERFPDGQLYVNLRGFDPTDSPMRPAEALVGFLHALGARPERTPDTVDDQAALYRSLTAERSMLVVLDNARDAEHVRALLPANPACVVVITSRNQLADLTAQQGASTFTLDVLSQQDARALLTRHLGRDRVSAEPDAVSELIEQCARLPLALAIAAARAETHPGFTLRSLVNELADTHTRLEGLDTGEATTSVRTVFSWSYNNLSAAAARTFRLLGLHPGPDIALLAVARLTDLDLAQARETLGELVRAHLLTQHTHGRYTCHDLLRAYAENLAAAHDPQDDQTGSLIRLFDHYLHTTAAAMRILHPQEELWPDIAPPATTTSPVTDVTTAEAWFDTELANLTVIIAHSSAYGWHTHDHRLATMLRLHHVSLGDNNPGGIHAHTLQAARHTGDRTTEGYALTYIGISRWQQGRYQRASDHFREAIAIARDIGNRVGEVLALNHLGLVHWRQGDYRSATEQHQRALTIARDDDFRVGEVLALNYLGFIHFQQGRYQQAIECHHQALDISREIRFPPGEAFALNNIGFVDCQQGRYQQATEHHQQALDIFHEIDFRLGEASGETNLGIVHCRQGHYQQATEHHRQALRIAREIGDRASEPLILNQLGTTYHSSGHLDQARLHHTAALTLATELGDPYEQARAHHGIAQYHHTANNHTETRRHLRQALTVYTDLGVPDAHAVRTELTALDHT